MLRIVGNYFQMKESCMIIFETVKWFFILLYAEANGIFDIFLNREKVNFLLWLSSWLTWYGGMFIMSQVLSEINALSQALAKWKEPEK